MRTVLVCGFCGLRPGGTAEIGMLAEHQQIEHGPLPLGENGNPMVSATLLPLHDPCDEPGEPITAPPCTAYRCPACGDTFTWDAS